MAKKRKTKSTGIEAGPAMDKDWRAESDLRTLDEAHKVISDSGRLSAAKRKAKEQQESLARIARLKDRKI